MSAEPTTSPPGLTLAFTGKACLVLELRDYEPMSFQLNDQNLVLALMRLILAECDTDLPVHAYGKRYEQRLARLLSEIE